MRMRLTRRCGPGFVLLLMLLMLLVTLLSACGVTTAAPPVLAGGVYSKPAFHFSLTYPAGWLVNEEDDASSSVFPLTVIITRSNSTATDGRVVSNLSIAILDLHNPQAVNKDLLKTVTTRATNPDYHAVTLAGQTAYATDSAQQPVYGTNQTATHTDYYLLANQFEYHISTDVIAGDTADQAIKDMLASLTITG